MAGLGDFDGNVLGFIDVFSTGLTAAGYYQYGSPDAASYNGDANGGPVPVSSLTQTFFVAASDGLAMFTVHDNPNDGSGGSADMSTLLSQAISGAQNLGDGEAAGETPIGGGPSYTTTHDWVECCTDGFVIGPLTVGMTIISGFTATPTGISAWQATGDSAADISFVLTTGRRARYDLVSEPGTAAVLGLGLVGLGIARRRKAA